jgi:hypothetical protein
MSNELKMQLPSDQSKINTNNLGEIIWWCAHLGTGPEKLLSVIDKVGNSTEKVRAFFSSREKYLHN